jgi:hypothetical protein
MELKTRQEIISQLGAEKLKGTTVLGIVSEQVQETSKGPENETEEEFGEQLSFSF